MENLFSEFVVLETAAFVLTFVPGLKTTGALTTIEAGSGNAFVGFLVLDWFKQRVFAQRWLAQRTDRAVGISGCAAGLVAALGRAGGQRLCDLVGGQV